MFSDMASLELIHSIYSLVTGVNALESTYNDASFRQSLPLPVFELQLESSTNIFHVFGSFCATGFSVYESVTS